MVLTEWTEVRYTPLSMKNTIYIWNRKLIWISQSVMVNFLMEKFIITGTEKRFNILKISVASTCRFLACIEVVPSFFKRSHCILEVTVYKT